MDDILTGVGEFFNERGCYVLHFLENQPPHIKVRRHSRKGFVKVQIIENELYLTYRLNDHSTQSYAHYELSNPDSLTKAMNYVKKHLFPPKIELRGGLVT